MHIKLRYAHNNSICIQRRINKLKVRLQHGNYAKIDKNKKIIPRYSTYTLTSKKEQHGNEVPLPLAENQIIAREEVDENHK